jgi:hypothetical protein
MATKSRNKKKLKAEVYNIIRNDISLRHLLAKALNIEADSVYRSAFRKSTKFSLPFIVDIIAKHTGKSKDEILEK